jgi:GAF domain-containing protein
MSYQLTQEDIQDVADFSADAAIALIQKRLGSKYQTVPEQIDLQELHAKIFQLVLEELTARYETET